MMKQFEFYYDILLEFDVPVEAHAFVLRCIPPSFPGQEIKDIALTLEPQVSWVLQRDGFGNLLEAGRVEQPHTRLHYGVRGTAKIDPGRRVKENAHPIFRFPSKYTGMSGEMWSFLKNAALPEEPREKAFALAELVHSHFTYLPGITGVATTAAEAFSKQAGVCQDFAHVYLALARACGLHARYVNGLPEGEGASHAWCEVHVDGIWTGIDPTRLQWCDAGYIRFNVGRDFEDCPMERGVFLGSASQCQTVFMRVSEQ